MTTVQLIQWMQTLSRDHHKKVFTVREMAFLARESRPATAMTLLRAAKKKLVARAGTLWINLMDPPELLEVALALQSPSYLSMEGALYRHGILSQAPRGSLTLVTAGRPRRFRTPLGDIRFFHLKPSLFSGSDSRRIAFPEKAWLDLIYLRGLRGRKIIFNEKFYTERIDRRRLKKMGEKFPGWVGEIAFSD